VGRNVTVWSCARHGSIRGGAARLVVAAGVAAITLWVSVGPAVRAAADDATYHFAGTVVDPQGKPITGAKVWFEYALARPPAQVAPPDAVSDGDGKFQFSRTKSSLSDILESYFPTIGVLVATKEGFGFAAGSADRFETTGRLASDRPKLFRAGVGRVTREGAKEDRMLRLVLDDVPLHGEVVDDEGRPVAGASLEVLAVWARAKGTLDAWEAGKKKLPLRQGISPLFWRYNTAGALSSIGARRRFTAINGLWEMRAVPFAGAKTDSAGHFTLKGIGRERLVEVLVGAKGLETAHEFARTRVGETIEMRDPSRSKLGGISPGKCTFKLGPSVPIQGQVVESGTGRALAGVRVVSTSTLMTRTVTDANGQYRLEGVPFGAVTLEVIPPSGTGTPPVEVNVSTSGRMTAVRRDIAVPAGVLVHGRAIDERTGKPVAGNLTYFAWEKNPQVRKAPEPTFRCSGLGVQTDAEGRFAIAALVGPGFLAFDAGPQFHFGVGAEQINCPAWDNAARHDVGKVFRTVPHPCRANSFNLLVPLDPRPDTREMTVDLNLRSGVDVTARVRTFDGQPLGTYYVLGAAGEYSWAEQSADRLTIVGCYPEETRRLFLYQPARNLVASADVTGVPPDPIEIRLRPGGSIIGRLLDEDGLPVEGAWFSYDLMPLRAAVGHLAEMKRELGIVPDVWPFLATDEKGRFAIKGLIPGLKYSARAVIERRQADGRSQRVAPLFTDVTTKSGETKDLGDVRVKPPEVP
jgi:protocatechuate 3,4-dioxygenase beta subunit